MPNHYGIQTNTRYNYRHGFINTIIIILYTFLIDIKTIIGTANYLKVVDPNLFYGASLMFARQPAPMYSPEFYTECVQYVREEFLIDLNRDLNMSNCLDIYNVLVGSFE